MKKWHIAVYGPPDNGDDVLELVCYQNFNTSEVAKLLVEHLESLNRYDDFEFLAREGPAHGPRTELMFD